MVCNRSLYLPGNPKPVWYPARLIKEGGCVDLSMDTLHLKYPLVLFGSEGSALTLPLFLLSPRIIMLCHCSETMTKDHFLLIFYGINPYAAGGQFGQCKMMQKTSTITETLASERTQWGLSNEYQHDRFWVVFEKSLHHCALDKSSISIERLNDLFMLMCL